MLSTHEFCISTFVSLRSTDPRGNSTYPVADAPHGNSDTFGDSQARAGDGGIVVLLLSQLRRCDVLGNTDIELGDGNIKPGSSESGQLSLDTSDLAENQMCL